MEAICRRVKEHGSRIETLYFLFGMMMIILFYYCSVLRNTVGIIDYLGKLRPTVPKYLVEQANQTHIRLIDNLEAKKAPLISQEISK